MNHPLLQASAALPWVEVEPGFSIKLLHGRTDDQTRVELLRLEPGTVIRRHRHQGEVHALNLLGQRQLLDTGEVVGPGGYVYEPPGNIDSWMAVGTEPLVVFVTVRGAIETLDDQGNVASRSTTSSIAESYQRAVQALGAGAQGSP